MPGTTERRESDLIVDAILRDDSIEVYTVAKVARYLWHVREFDSDRYADVVQVNA
jgi:hypothetical protein